MPRGKGTGRRGEGRDGKKIEWKLSEVNTRLLSIGQSVLVGELKIAVGDVINIGVGYEAHIHSNRN